MLAYHLAKPGYGALPLLDEVHHLEAENRVATPHLSHDDFAPDEFDWEQALEVSGMMSSG